MGESKANVLIMDFGGSAIKYCLMDEHGVQTGRDDVVAPRDPAEFDKDVKMITDKFKGQYEGISVSFPGFVQLNSDLTGGGAFPFFHGHNLIDEFRRVTGVEKICVENDGKCGALAEAWDGPLSDVHSGMVIIMGSGIAGGLILDRKLIKNKHCTAGELSGINYNSHTVGRNAMGVCSATSLTMDFSIRKGQLDPNDQRSQFMVKWLGLDDVPAGERDHAYDGVQIDGKKVFEALDAGDPDAAAAYERLLRGAATLAYNMQLVFAPDRICFGGGITRQERVVPDIRKMYYTIMTENMPPELAAMLGRTDMSGAIKVNDANDAEIVSCKHTGDANQFGAMYNYLMTYRPELLQ